MTNGRFSRRAEADFDDITAYTVRTWGTLLDDYCQRLADTTVLATCEVDEVVASPTSCRS